MSGSFQGPTRIEAIAATSTAVFSNKATYVAYRGPWATGRLHAGAAARHHRPGARHRTDRRPAAQLRRPGRTAPRHAHRARRSAGSPPSERSSRPPSSSTGRLSVAPAGAPGRRAATSDSASPPTSRPRPGRASQRPMRSGGIMGERGHPHVGRAGQASDLIITQQQPHGQGHETTLAQVAVRRARRAASHDVTRPLRRHRLHPARPGRHRRQPGRDHGQRRGPARARASCGARSSPRRRPARGEPRRPRDRRRRGQREGYARGHRVASREMARIVEEEPERLPGGHRHRRSR